MDPNANLQEQERILTTGGDRARLRELRVALGEWLEGGGFAPDWSQAPRAARAFKGYFQYWREAR